MADWENTNITQIPSCPMNNRTLVVSRAGGYRVEPIKEVFHEHYSQIRELIGGISPPAFLLFVARANRSRGSHLVMPLLPQEGTDVIVGRHEQCGLRLPNDSSVSLRHLLIRTLLNDAGEARLKILDLNTPTGFLNEAGKVSRGLISDGPMFLTLGQYHLMALHHHGQAWPDTAEEAWMSLPQRKIIDEIDTKESQPAVHAQARLRPATSISVVRITTGPSHIEHMSLDESRALGFLLIKDDHRDLSLRLSAEALSAGVLVGRYERCEINSATLRFPDAVSRVHLCLLHDETGLWAIDMASTNGTSHQGKGIASLRMENNTQLELPGGITLRWHLA